MRKKKKQSPFRKRLVRKLIATLSLMALISIILLFALVITGCTCSPEINTYDVTLTTFARMKTQAAATPIFAGG